MKPFPFLLMTVALAAGCSDSRDVQKTKPAEGPTAPAPATSPASITSAGITVSDAGKASTVCAVYLAEIDKAHAALLSNPADEAAAEQVQVFATLAKDACN